MHHIFLLCFLQLYQLIKLRLLCFVIWLIRDIFLRFCREQSLISLEHTFQLNTSIHFLYISEVPAAVDVPLLGEHLALRPIFEKWFSVKVLFAWIYYFESLLWRSVFRWDWSWQWNNSRWCMVNKIILSVGWLLTFWLLTWSCQLNLCIFDLICIFERSRSRSGPRWHDLLASGFAIPILSTLTSFLVSRCLLADASTICLNDDPITINVFQRILVSFSDEWLDIWDRESASTVGTQRCVGLVHSLLEPSNKLAPNILTVILFASSILLLTLVLLVHVCTFRMLNITVSNNDRATSALFIRFSLCEVVFRAWIHLQYITEGWNGDF